MRLIWFIYSNHTDLARRRYRRKYILGIVIQEVYGKIHMLETSKLTDKEVWLIRTYLDELKSLNGYKRLRWFRDYMPTAFNKAYKTIYKDRIEIIDEYDIKSAEEV